MAASKRVHILLACMPKSGSTFLSEVIGHLPGFQSVSLIPTAEGREQELDEFCLHKANALNYVAQVHVRHSGWTEDMRRDYGLAPVVLVRGLFDVVVSLRDHMRREGTRWPMFFAEPHHAGLDDAALEMMIVRLAAPWYVNFYMSWRRAPGAIMVSYEALTQAPTQVVGEIMAACGADVPPTEIEAAMLRVLRAGQTRLNVGVAGRGRELRPEAVRAILDLVAFYPEAADDPYIQDLQAEGEAILSGRAAPPRQAAAIATASRPKLRKSRSLLIRRVLPAALIGLALLYWIWPADLLPDARPYGQLDDVACLALLSMLAGRLSKFKPRLRIPGSQMRRAARGDTAFRPAGRSAEQPPVVAERPSNGRASASG